MKNKLQKETLFQEELASVLDARFTQYAFMSLEDRALPDARDGLKPSQRRVLIAMNDLNLKADGGTEKSAKICGDTSGNYHPHGEAVVYPTMFRLVQPWVMRYPLLVGQGNFGNVDGDPPAAMRYTEAKLSVFGEALLHDLSESTVEFQSNYNEKRKEPVILPALFPNLLVNGCEGIAVGWATKMLPHNMKEVANLVKEYIRNPNISYNKILKIMPGPDFPTGGKILGQDGVLDYYKSGRGTLKIEGSYEIKREGKFDQIVVYELPYQSSPDQFCDEIKSLVESNKLSGIVDLKNLSSKKTGIQIIVDIAKGENVELIINKLLKQTCLRKSISVNSTVLINNKVVPEANILDLVKTFVEHRKSVLIKKYDAELNKTKNRIHILEGLLGIKDKIDLIIKIIRSSNDPEDAEAELINKKVVKTVEQAKSILSITLRQLTKLEYNKLLQEKEKLIERSNWLEKTLGNQQEILEVIISEQEEFCKKFADNRRTKITKEAVEIEIEDLIKDEDVVISITGDGYINSNNENNFKFSNGIFERIDTNSKNSILFFTNKGSFFQRKIYEIPSSKKGTHCSAFLNLSVGEKVVNIHNIEDFNQDCSFIFVTKNGLVKKSVLKEYDLTRKVGITAISLNDGDELVFAGMLRGPKDLFIATSKGQCARYADKIVPIQGRSTRGSRALKLDPGDFIVQSTLVDCKSKHDVLIAVEGGCLKRTPLSEYKPSLSRQVRGSHLLKKQILDKFGKVVDVVFLQEESSVLILSPDSKYTTVDAKKINSSNKLGNGFKVSDELIEKIFVFNLEK